MGSEQRGSETTVEERPLDRPLRIPHPNRLGPAERESPSENSGDPPVISAVKAPNALERLLRRGNERFKPRRPVKPVEEANSAEWTENAFFVLKLLSLRHTMRLLA